MALYGMPKGPLAGLREAFNRCVEDWGSDPAYREATFTIDQALRCVELMEASPGMRSAWDTGMPGTSSLQGPGDAGQPPREMEEPSQKQGSRRGRY